MGTRKLCFLMFFLTMNLSIPLQSQEREVLPPDPVHHNPRKLGQSFLAGMVTAMNIPLRGILCVVDAGLGFIVMGVSAGRSYARAAEIMEDGCAGPWVIDARMIREGRLRHAADPNKGFFEAGQP